MTDEELTKIIQAFAETPLKGSLLEQLLSVLNYWRSRAKLMENDSKSLQYQNSTLSDQLRMWEDFKDILLLKLGVEHPEGLPLDELVFPIIENLKPQ
jgi:hypothetical protein